VESRCEVDAPSPARVLVGRFPSPTCGRRWPGVAGSDEGSFGDSEATKAAAVGDPAEFPRTVSGEGSVGCLTRTLLFTPERESCSFEIRAIFWGALEYERRRYSTAIGSSAATAAASARQQRHTSKRRRRG
jgi:hypothetical protein